jgi:hypothetical protein
MGHAFYVETALSDMLGTYCSWTFNLHSTVPIMQSELSLQFMQ